jgi:polar amino acid transport system substrate-binding protein
MKDLVSGKVVNEDRTVAGALDYISQQINLRKNLTFVFTDVSDIEDDSPTSHQFHCQEHMVQETDVSALVDHLQNGDIDLWGYSEATGRFFAMQIMGNYYTFKVVYTLPAVESYYAFNKDVPDATVQSFQTALDEIIAEKDATGISTYEKIIGRYNPSIGLAHLQYLTEEWAPYNYLEGENVTGIAVDILEAVFRDMGVNRTRKDVRIVPLADGFRTALNTSTVLFSIVRTPERESLYKWAGPFTKSEFVVFAPMSRNITMSGPSDMNQYRIGAVRASIENDLLRSHGVNASHIVSGATPEELLNMMESGQIDFWATGDLAGRNQMLKTAKDPNAYEIIYTLGEKEFYYIFSRDVPDTLVSAFQQALGRVRNQKDTKGVSAYERIIYNYLGVGCARPSFTDEQVMDLVNITALAIEKDAADTLIRISAGEAPYRNLKNPELYVFVYDINETMVAHADNILVVGSNLRGKTDVMGSSLHDEILAGALQNGTGWVEYVYINPVQTNLYYKTTYFRLTKGSDGQTYIVCSGNFKIC